MYWVKNSSSSSRPMCFVSFCCVPFESKNSCCVNILSASYLGLVDNLKLYIYAGLPYKIILHIPNIYIYVFIPTEQHMMCIGRCCRWTPKQRWFYSRSDKKSRKRQGLGRYISQGQRHHIRFDCQHRSSSDEFSRVSSTLDFHEGYIWF